MSKRHGIGLFCTKSWQMLETGYALLIVAEMVRLRKCRARLSRQYGIMKGTLCGLMEAHHALSTLHHLWIKRTCYNLPFKCALTGEGASANIKGHGSEQASKAHLPLSVAGQTNHPLSTWQPFPPEALLGGNMLNGPVNQWLHENTIRCHRWHCTSLYLRL